MIKLVIFDLWKTLAISGYKSITEGIIKTLDLKIEKETARKIYEQSVQTRKYNSETESYEQLCLSFKVKPTAKIISELTTLFNEKHKSPILFPHTLNMLKQLKSQGIKIGLISNTSEPVIKLIKQDTELFDHIDYPMFSYDTGIIKPNPKVYLLMLKKAGSKPSEAVMVGDSLIDDIEPAKKLGMKAIHFRDYEQLKKELEGIGISI